MNTHDAIVIGSGRAGPSMAVRLAQSGLKVALIEREHCGAIDGNHATHEVCNFHGAGLGARR